MTCEVVQRTDQQASDAKVHFRSLAELQREYWQERQVEAREKLHCQDEQPRPESAVATGAVRKVLEGKGFAFVTVKGSTATTSKIVGDVFLHFSDLAAGVAAKDIIVGTQVEFETEVVQTTGQIRARNARVVVPKQKAQPIARRGRNGWRKIAAESATSSTASTASTVSVEAEEGPNTPRAVVPSTTAYSRTLLLTLRKQTLGEPPAVSVRMAVIPANASEGGSKLTADPELDDEKRIAMLETRLSAESGADALNLETFGEAGGWSFEEALKANTRLAAFGADLGKDLEQHCTSTTADSAPSECCTELATDPEHVLAADPFQ